MYRKYVEIVRTRWLLLALGVANALAAAVLFSATTPPRYESTVRLITGQTAQSGLTYSSLLADQELAKTYAQLATARPVLEAVIGTLQLAASPEDLSRQIHVNLIPETRLMDITVQDNDPEQAAAIANAVGQEISVFGNGGSQSADSAVRESIQGDVLTIRELAEQSQQELQRLNQQIAAAEAAGEDPTEVRARRDAEQEKLARWHSTLASLYQTLMETTGSSIRVVAPAAVPMRSSSTALPLSLALAALVGLGLAFGVALVQEVLDDTIRSPSQLPTDERLPFLGAVPRFPSQRFMPRQQRVLEGLVARHRPQSAAAESYRAIRTALRSIVQSSGPQALLVTSSLPGEGKTTTVANLGVLLAQMGKQVVVVDADLRNPNLHSLFGMSNSVGLSNALQEDQGAVRPRLLETGIERLRLLPSGPPVPSSAELLASNRMELLLTSLLSSFDIVIFDTPPMLSLTDAAVAASSVDHVLLVARAGLSTTEDVIRSRDILLATGALLLGVVLTAADQPLSRYYGHYDQYHPSNASNGASVPVNGSQLPGVVGTPPTTRTR